MYFIEYNKEGKKIVGVEETGLCLSNKINLIHHYLTKTCNFCWQKKNKRDENSLNGEKLVNCSI